MDRRRRKLETRYRTVLTTPLHGSAPTVRAVATYSVAGVRIQRTRTNDDGNVAGREARAAVLDELERRGIDPEFIAIERALMRAVIEGGK